VGGNTLCSEIHKLTNSIWNREELPPIIVPIYKKDDKNDYSSYKGISLLPRAEIAQSA
jgi:hypothetical protein